MDVNPSLRGGVKTLPFLTGFTILGGDFQGMKKERIYNELNMKLPGHLV